jgi:hypothetical protein
VVRFHAGDAVVYLKPRSQPTEDGERWDRIPASYVCACAWGDGFRHKITWRNDEGWQHRYVHVLSITKADRPSETVGAVGE